jgi:hypothetical protein
MLVAIVQSVPRVQLRVFGFALYRGLEVSVVPNMFGLLCAFLAEQRVRFSVHRPQERFPASAPTSTRNCSYSRT